MKTIEYFLVTILVAAFFSIVIFNVTGCAQAPTSRDFMAQCKSVCRASVHHYQDDTIECLCKE